MAADAHFLPDHAVKGGRSFRDVEGLLDRRRMRSLVSRWLMGCRGWWRRVGDGGMVFEKR
jgi:hypothetical protein